ncbi:MAG: AAA family ATPase [Legionellaceae bacterium]|nr:AAA family ATPase [Legionellaceae bacterium]
MKSLHKFLLTFCFLNAILCCPFAEASEMRFSLLEESPTFQSNTLLDWSWWGDDSKSKPKRNSTAFQMDDILELAGKLNEVILGQEFAINEVTNHLISYQAGINDPNKPIGVFLFIGPTGVGKTQLAKELSKSLLGSEINMIRLDMSEYTSRENIWSLIGSARGYMDSDKGGVLTEALRGRKNAIILLDEIEKAAPEVLKLFLSAFDEGRITSSTGETFNLNSAIFILTTNIASEEIFELSNEGFDNENILALIEGRVVSYLSPEFYNRTTPTIFKAIPHALYPKIIDRELSSVSKRLLSVKKIHLAFDPSVNEYLFNSLQSNRLGVRPLKRLIEKHVTGNLAHFIVRNNPKPDSNILISVEGNEVIVREQEVGV